MMPKFTVFLRGVKKICGALVDDASDNDSNDLLIPPQFEDVAH